MFYLYIHVYVIYIRPFLKDGVYIDYPIDFRVLAIIILLFSSGPDCQQFKSCIVHDSLDLTAWPDG